MPTVEFDQAKLREFGAAWSQGAEVVKKGQREQRSSRLGRIGDYSGANLGVLANQSVAQALSHMLGGFRIVPATGERLLPESQYLVEVGEVRVIGGVRPQNYDVAYRPDGIRFVFDSKTLNDTDSIRKNYQNMINDLGTEATTAHTRFPYAVVAFMVLIPLPCMRELSSQVTRGILGNLERLVGRVDVNGPVHKAEAISLVVWDPDAGSIDQSFVAPQSPLHLQRFSEMISDAYISRYQGLDPHSDKDIPKRWREMPTVATKASPKRRPSSKNVPPSLLDPDSRNN